MTRTFELETAKDGWYVIDEQVRRTVEESGVKDGICLLYLPHTTAGFAITSSWDPKGIEDSIRDVKAKFPARTSYAHPYSPFASAARARAALTGGSRTLIVRDGALLLGHSQTLLLYEFDGPQLRSFTVTVLPRALWFGTAAFESRFGEMRDVTGEVAEIVRQSGVREGFCHVTVVAATAGLMLCAAGEEVQADVWEDVERLIPTRADFHHRETASDAAGHSKTFVAGTQLDLPVADGAPVLGRDQRIVYAEFDGPRPRDIRVAVYADGEEGRTEDVKTGV